MRLPIAALLFALQLGPADAFLDPGARELVARARERRESVDLSLRAYRTLAKEHISVGVRALGRERVLYRRELAARVDWRRDGAVRVEYVGAREATPTGKVEVPEELTTEKPHFVFEPGSRTLLVGLNDSTFTRHPLARGSEADYRFRSGDTTTIRLPGGTVRLLELRVLPRRADPHLIDGSLWLDAATGSLVRAVYRPAAPWVAGVDIEKKDRSVQVEVDDEGKRGASAAVLPRLRAEARYITVEYGLHDMRWWMPRAVAIEGVAEFGPISAPFRLERSYTEYEVEGSPDGVPPAEWAAADSSFARDSTRSGQLICNAGRCRRFEARVVADTARLLASPELPPSLFGDGGVALNPREADAIVRELERLVPTGWALGEPRVEWGPQLPRYNPVEGLSAGVRAEVEVERISADAAVRLGSADLVPVAEIGVTRRGLGTQRRVAAYRRLDLMNPDSRALSPGNSVSALLWGRDDGEYFRTLGVELSGAPARTLPQRYAWRVFAERQTAVENGTDWSASDLWNDGRSFVPNLAAERADQVGASLTLRTARGLDPLGWRWGAEGFVEASVGTFRFARPSLALNGTAPLPGPWVGAAEIAAGTSVGTVPTQSLWFLGGPGSVRGYGGAAARGESFWRGRLEVATAMPLGRVAVFGDAGWAGERKAVSLSPELLSAGVGFSLLDGLLRLDLARALLDPEGWRADLYLDAAL